MPAIIDTVTVAITSHIGSAVRARRTARGESLRSLARRADLTPAAVSAIELGKVTPSVTNAWKLAAVLDVPLSTLISDIEKEDSQC